MNLIIKKIKNNNGVTLIELLVSITIFSFMILSATQIFTMVTAGQRNAISAQNVQENMRYAMEKMSKEMRMAQISNHACESGASPSSVAAYKVFNTTYDAGEIYFMNKDGQCVYYHLVAGRLKIKVGQGVDAIEDFITPSNIAVSNLKFYAVDDLIGAFHSTQPYVTMVMDVKSVGLAINEQKMKIQITVSSRYYE